MYQVLCTFHSSVLYTVIKHTKSIVHNLVWLYTAQCAQGSEWVRGGRGCCVTEDPHQKKQDLAGWWWWWCCCWCWWWSCWWRSWWWWSQRDASNKDGNDHAEYDDHHDVDDDNDHDDHSVDDGRWSRRVVCACYPASDQPSPLPAMKYIHGIIFISTMIIMMIKILTRTWLFCTFTFTHNKSS